MGYRWDHFLLLKFDEKLTNFERLTFSVKLKTCFELIKIRAVLRWSSRFNFSDFKDFKLISLPGRIYESTLKINKMTVHQNEHLKNNSLSLIWLHERFPDSRVPGGENKHCGVAKFNFNADSRNKCFSTSLSASALIVKCLLNIVLGPINSKCLKFKLHEANETEYLIFRNKVPHSNNSLNSHKLSWIEASERCKNLGAMLPYFTSRKDLDQLIRVLKLTRGHFLQEGIFIGLLHNLSNKQVNY